MKRRAFLRRSTAFLAGLVVGVDQALGMPAQRILETQKSDAEWLNECLKDIYMDKWADVVNMRTATSKLMREAVREVDENGSLPL